MHLTNYAINKRSPKFVFNNSPTNMGIGHKRSLKCIYEQMSKKGLDVDKLKIKTKPSHNNYFNTKTKIKTQLIPHHK